MKIIMGGVVTCLSSRVSCYWICQLNFHESDDIGPQENQLPIELKLRIERLARLNGLSVSDVIRLMLFVQLPEVEAGRFKLKAELGISTRL